MFLHASRRYCAAWLPWLTLGVFLAASLALNPASATQVPEVEPAVSRRLVPGLAGGLVWTVPHLIPLLVPDAPLQDRR